MNNYLGTAQNKSIGRVRYELMERMIKPCGKPPKEADVDMHDIEGKEES